MPKTFKEYMSGLGGFRLGNLDSFRPIASLGDRPPKGQGNRDSRGVGLVANYTGQAPGTMRPFLTAAKKIQDKNKKDKVKIDGEEVGTMVDGELSATVKTKTTIPNLALGFFVLSSGEVPVA